MELLSQAEIRKVFERLKKANPNPQAELIYKNAYTLLVSVVLSAQATDKSVNKATEPLYKIADTPKKMLALGQKKLESYIKSIGLYRNKAANIIKLSEQLIENFGGQVPDTREELMTLPGVGRKTANVVLNVIFDKPTIPVDTHLFRVCPKIGLAQGATPLEVEQSLLERVPKKYMKDAHHWLLLHGRHVCVARSPKCGECVIKDLCKKNEQ
ncbi:MAG: endonuclease III [Treponema sp.]|nr:endonuclease III [Treponema sp.]